MLLRPHYSSKHKINYYSFMINWPYQETKKRCGLVQSTEKRIYLHLFHNDQRAADDKTALNELLDKLEAEAASGVAATRPMRRSTANTTRSVRPRFEVYP